MSKPIIEKIIIKGLFGSKDVYLDLNVPCRILIGENGLGKTTILSMINLFITGEYSKLIRYSFKEISITIGKVFFMFTRGEFEEFNRAYSYHSDDYDMKGLILLEKSLASSDLNAISEKKSNL